MTRIFKGLLGLILLMPVPLLAQSASLAERLDVDATLFCQTSWNDDSRLYQACLQEQRQALGRLQSLHRQYASQVFYLEVAFPYCRSTGAGQSVDLVQMHFCLNDEVAGYREILNLQRRYGGSRVAGETSRALEASGSWAAAARQVKRETYLKTIRQGTTP